MRISLIVSYRAARMKVVDKYNAEVDIEQSRLLLVFVIRDRMLDQLFKERVWRARHYVRCGQKRDFKPNCNAR